MFILFFLKNFIFSAFVFFFFYFFLFLGQRETEHERGRGRERGRHRIGNRLQAISPEPDAGLELTDRVSGKIKEQLNRWVLNDKWRVTLGLQMWAWMRSPSEWMQSWWGVQSWGLGTSMCVSGKWRKSQKRGVPSEVGSESRQQFSGGQVEKKMFQRRGNHQLHECFWVKLGLKIEH